MSEWKEGVLNDIAEILMGQSPSGETCNNHGLGLPLLNGPTEFGIKNPSAIQFTTDARKLSKPNDILFCVRGSTTGRMNWSDKEYAIGRGLAAIRHKQGSEYKYFVRGIIDYNLPLLLASATGSTFPNISKNQLEGLDVSIPPLTEQLSIASILSSLDDKIDLLHRQNATLEKMAETLFRQWFVEEAEESWESVKICDVAKINGKSISKNYPFTDIEYLDTGAITAGTISEFQTYKLVNAPSRAQRIVENNDIVYSLVRPIQRHYGLINNVKPNTIVSTGFCVITCTDFSPHYIYLLLTSNENIEYLNVIAEASTSTYPSLKPSDIANFEFSKPPVEKLNRFSKIATDIWIKLHTNQTQIRTLTALRDTLLPKLMSDAVRVKND